MDRRSLIKSILGLAAAPKILAEINFNPPIAAAPVATKGLFSDLQLLTPQYYNTLVEKYGNTNYTGLIEEIGKAKDISRDNYFWFESKQGNDENK